MLKQYKWKMMVSTLVILSPMLFGLAVWNRLPTQMATHWGMDGAADGWSSRAGAVFTIPIFVLLMHWLCMLLTTRDPKNQNQSGKILGIVFWICPVVSMVSGWLTYSTALGKAWNPNGLVCLLMGIMFVVIGNELPKCKQNSTIGIKVKWALENEENWNATHRFGGKLWVIGGALLMLCALLPEEAAMYVTLAVLLPLAVLPIGYSWRYHKKREE